MANQLTLFLIFLSFSYLVQLQSLTNETNSTINIMDSQNYNVTMKYLYDYGYLDAMKNVTAQKMAAVIKDFQHFYGIKPSGEMDKETSEMINRPRCGMPDKVKVRAKRYSFFGKRIWEKRKLLYYIHEYTWDLKPTEINRELGRALNVWSQFTGMKFEQTYDGPSSDINITFIPQDGEGRVLAYASKPVSGKVVFDDDEVWTKESPNGVNLFQAAVHEFGHSLGLGHSDIKKSIMYPQYMGYTANFSLHIDDIKGITALYKIRSRHPDVRLGDNAVLCKNSKIDAIFDAPDNFVYLLKGDKFWKFSSEFVMVEGPNLIVNRWPHLPNDIDAAFTSWNNITYFFKGKFMWKYVLKKKIGKSKLISVGFDGIPSDINASFIWSGNGGLYFFKGKNYWKFDHRKPIGMRVKHIYPALISRWNGLPNNLDAAVAMGGFSYFFKDHQYYKYNDMNLKVEDGYPRNSATDFFGCSST